MTGGTPTLLLLGHRTAPRSPTRCDCRATDPASPSPDDLRIGPQPNRARAQEPRAEHTSGVLALASPCFPSRELITAHVSSWPIATNSSFGPDVSLGRSGSGRAAEFAASVENDPYRHKGSRLRCAARFNDDAGTWYADLITIGRREPNDAEGIHRPYRECGGAAAVSSARRARRSPDASTDLAY